MLAGIFAANGVNAPAPKAAASLDESGIERAHRSASMKHRLSHRAPLLQPSHRNLATCGPAPGSTVNREDPQEQDRNTPERALHSI
jgi:hypothetical protein